MNIAWGITGAGHFLNETFEIFQKLKGENPDLKVSSFISRAGEEVIQMYGLMKKLNTISNGGYLEEVFLERDQGASVPKTGRFLLDRYDALVVSPATSNTTAKIAYGIADTLVTNAVAQAVKGSVPVFVVPVDIAGTLESKMPYFIDRTICMRCELCPPAMDCPQNALTEQIDLLKCNGCGLCVKLCSFGAIKGGLAKVKIRDIDSENVERLRRLEGINVLEKPVEIQDVILELKSKVEKHACISYLKNDNS